MVEYTKVNVKLTNLQLNKLKKAVKNNDSTTLRIGIKNLNKEDLPHELLLTTRQSTKLRNAVNNNMETDMKLSKAQIKKLIQSGVYTQKIHGSGVKLIEQEDMNDIMKIIEALKNSGILLKRVTKTIENEHKEQGGGFLSMLFGTLGASLLGNLLTGRKGIVRAG